MCLLVKVKAVSFSGTPGCRARQNCMLTPLRHSQHGVGASDMGLTPAMFLNLEKGVIIPFLWGEL